jgi:hypothetical protein
MFLYDDSIKYGIAPLFGGYKFNPDAVASVKNATQVIFKFTTDERRLLDYVPPRYTLLKPEVTIGYAMFRECDFLGGSGYNALLVSLPVHFHGEQDQLDGDLNLVVWENRTIPIIGGREDSGIPKIPADIEDLHIFGDKYFANLSFEGNTFLQLEMLEPQPVTGHKLEEIKKNSAVLNQLGWRYISKIGEPGADLNQFTLYPQFFTVQSAWMGSGTFHWTKMKYEQNEREYHIINALAGLPVKSMRPVMMIKGIFDFKPFLGRVIR